jgi:multidrug resistance efflux pump
VFTERSRAADVEAADATMKERGAAVAQLQRSLENLEIRAPFAGLVAQRTVEVGTAVGRDVPVVKLVAGDGLLVRFAVDPDRAAELRPGQPLSVFVPAADVHVEAAIERIAPELDSATQIVVVEGRVGTPPPGVHLTPGLMVRVLRSPAP